MKVGRNQAQVKNTSPSSTLAAARSRCARRLDRRFETRQHPTAPSSATAAAIPTSGYSGSGSGSPPSPPDDDDDSPPAVGVGLGALDGGRTGDNEGVIGGDGDDDGAGVGLVVGCAEAGACANAGDTTCSASANCTTNLAISADRRFTKRRPPAATDDRDTIVFVNCGWYFR